MHFVLSAPARALLLVLAIVAVGCGTQAPPTNGLPQVPTPQAPQTQPAGGTELAACPIVPAHDAAAASYLSKPPEPNDIPGAGEPDEEEMNEGEKPPTPPDPSGIVDADAGLPPAAIKPPAAQGQELPTDVVLYRQPASVTNVSPIAEPNIASAGSATLMTWNWGAARSFDGGTTLQYMNPYKDLSDSTVAAPDGGFCCDQLAHHDDARNLWIWVLQYRTAEEHHRGNNRIRIAVAHGNEAFTNYWDLRSTGSGGLPSDGWYDQPKIGTTGGHLFLAINVFGPDSPLNGKPPFLADIVYRLDLDDLANGSDTQPDCFTTSGQPDASKTPIWGVVPVRQAIDTMFLGAHFSLSTLAVWRWPDSDTQPTIRYAPAQANGKPESYPATSKYSCLRTGVTDPDTDWCARASDEITTAWLSGASLGFAWTAAPDPANGWPYPSVWANVIDTTRLDGCIVGGCVVQTPKMRSPTLAFEYAAIAPNSTGELGASVLYGGAAQRESCAVGILGSSGSTPNWQLTSVATSDREPDQPVAGDYQGIWPASGGATWAAACMLLNSAGTATGRDRRCLPHSAAVATAHSSARAQDQGEPPLVREHPAMDLRHGGHGGRDRLRDHGVSAHPTQILACRPGYASTGILDRGRRARLAGHRAGRTNGSPRAGRLREHRLRSRSCVVYWPSCRQHSRVARRRGLARAAGDLRAARQRPVAGVRAVRVRSVQLVRGHRPEDLQCR